MAIKLGFLMKNLEMNRIMAGSNYQRVENQVVKDTDTAEEKNLWTKKGGIPKRRKTAEGACKTVGMEKLITVRAIDIGIVLIMMMTMKQIEASRTGTQMTGESVLGKNLIEGGIDTQIMTRKDIPRMNSTEAGEDMKIAKTGMKKRKGVMMLMIKDTGTMLNTS